MSILHLPGMSILHLTLSLRRSLLYRNQAIDLLCKSMDWFLYDRDFSYEGAKSQTPDSNFLRFNP